MPVLVPVPGGTDLRLEHLVIDVNGTLTVRGQLLHGVEERLGRLQQTIDIRLLSADTFGTVDAIAGQLGDIPFERISHGDDKEALAIRLGREACAAVGNGANDVQMLRAAALGIAVIGPEGAASSALSAAEVVTTSVLDALDLLLHPQSLTATLRP